ncbi:Fic family protein [Nocardioides sp.]|uniref:Fic family protein n=1 Tax=Nocardioides sp. TaxID=35761 RepID=UPI00262B62D4|nr:Fic family protein [Nocardioides sp.]
MSSPSPATLHWPAHTTAVRPWRQRTVRGPSVDRRVREVQVSLPPRIADLDLDLDRPIAAMTTASLGDLRNLDLVHGRTLAGLNPLHLRTEAVDSSKIENIEASLADYGRALLGSGASSAAVSMAAATRAMSRLIERADQERSLSVAAIVEAHGELFARDPDERERAGRLRTVQNWVGGSDYSPRGALYVPPPPELVPGYLDDLVRFAQRDDLPILAQAAVVHAQFESIHPFIDGNGRIGRALLHAVLRRRRATRHLIVPIASALVSNRERYFAALGDYRTGDPHPLIAMLASGTSLATGQARAAADALVALRERWQHRADDPRPGTPVFRLLTLAAEEPILNVDLAVQRLALPAADVETAIAVATTAGVLRRAPRTRRTPVWVAPEVLGLLDDLRAGIRGASAGLKSRA